MKARRYEPFSNTPFPNEYPHGWGERRAMGTLRDMNDFERAELIVVRRVLLIMINEAVDEYFLPCDINWKVEPVYMHLQSIREHHTYSLSREECELREKKDAEWLIMWLTVPTKFEILTIIAQQKNMPIMEEIAHSHEVTSTVTVQQPLPPESFQRPQISPSDGQDNYSGKDLRNIFLEATLGWTPILLKHVKERNGCKAALFLFLFVVDLADAVFDVVLGVQDIYAGSDGSGNLGILLLVMTILGRILSGVYGLAMAKNPTSNEDLAFLGFAFMELGVFFLEDGAAILVLAKSTGSPSVIELMSTYLTVTCGLVYILYIVELLIDEWVHGYISGVGIVLVYAVLPLASFVFFMYILATEVIFAQDDDPPLSGELEVAAFVVYGITAFILGGYAMFIFCAKALE